MGFEAFESKFEPFRKGFEAFECKFKPFETYLKCSNEWFEKDLNHSNANSKLLKGILTIRIQIATIWTKFEAFEGKFEPFEWDLMNLNAS